MGWFDVRAETSNDQKKQLERVFYFLLGSRTEYVAAALLIEQLSSW